MHGSDPLSIGQLATRVGTSVSAIRFYEEKGLVFATRDAGGRRRFRRSDIRRLSFVLIAQQLGFSIREIEVQLSSLPDHRTPTKADWERLSRHFRHILDERIETMERLRDRLDGCIGCGCLSLKKCRLYNPDDRAGRRGAGARFVISDESVFDSDGNLIE